MSLTSMTGFARAVGAFGAWRWTVELKCVNAKGLDLRLRLPPAFDRIEAEAKTRIGKALARGTCFATIVAQREGGGVTARVDTALMAEIAAAAREAAEKFGLAPATLDGVLAVRGVVEVVESVDDEAAMAAAGAAV
ncbi:MAG: YicC/YloC family endoribonuclease, partial [Roseiarcus sp.]